MTKQELAEMLVAPHQDIKMWLKMTKKELELTLEYRTAPTSEARKSAQDALAKIRNLRWKRNAERARGIIDRTK